MFSIAVVPSDKLICRSGYHKIVFCHGKNIKVIKKMFPRKLVGVKR